MKQKKERRPYALTEAARAARRAGGRARGEQVSAAARPTRQIRVPEDVLKRLEARRYLNEPIWEVIARLLAD